MDLRVGFNMNESYRINDQIIVELLDNGIFITICGEDMNEYVFLTSEEFEEIVKLYSNMAGINFK
jgi:hypothetical protein